MTPRPRTPLLHPKAGAPRGAPSGNCPSAGQERSWSSEGALEQTGAAGWGGTHGGLGSKYRERAPSPAAPRVPSHPSAPAGGVPGLAGRGAQGRGGEGDLRGLTKSPEMTPYFRITLSKIQRNHRALPEQGDTSIGHK